MPKRVSVAEQNDGAFTLVDGALSSTPGFSVLGVTRVGSSSSGVGTWLQGTYGQILINADGTFTYRLNNLDPDTQLLAAGRIARPVERRQPAVTAGHPGLRPGDPYPEPDNPPFQNGKSSKSSARGLGKARVTGKSARTRNGPFPVFRVREFA